MWDELRNWLTNEVGSGALPGNGGYKEAYRDAYSHLYCHKCGRRMVSRDGQV